MEPEHVGLVQLADIPQHYQVLDHGHQYVPYEQFQALSDQVGNLGNTLYNVSSNVDTLAHNFTSFMNNFHYVPPPPREGERPPEAPPRSPPPARGPPPKPPPPPE